MRFLVALLVLTRAAWGDGERAGEFDYYILALSWSPTWCALEGKARSSPQCEENADAGWGLHGLWPQFETGWPSYCRTTMRNPSRAETASETDLFGTSGNAWHQWNKHGRCTGLSAGDYYLLSREALSRVEIPGIFRRLDHAVRLPASVIEEAFLEANPGLQANGITVTCKSRRIEEARICLTRDLRLRTCGADAVKDCTMQDALLDPAR